MLRGLASAVWYDHGGGNRDDFDARLEDAAAWTVMENLVQRVNFVTSATHRIDFNKVMLKSPFNGDVLKYHINIKLNPYQISIQLE